MSLIRTILSTLLGLLLVGVIAALASLFQAAYRFEFVFLLLPGVLVVSYLGGLFPGLLSAVTAAVLALDFFIEPVGLTPSKARENLVPGAIFLVAGLTTAIAGTSYRAIQKRLRRDLLATRRRERDEALLVEVGDVLASRQDRGGIGEAVSRVLADRFGDAAAIVLRDPETGLSRFETLYHPDAEKRAELRAELERLIASDDPVLAAASERTGAMIVRRDDPSLPRASEAQAFFARRGLAGALLVPLRFEDEALGSMLLLSQRSAAWDEQDLHAARAIADRLAVAVHQSALAQQRRRRERHTRFLSNVTVEFAREQDLATLLDHITRRCSEAFGEWCSIQLIDPEDAWLTTRSLHHQDAAVGARLRAVLDQNPYPRRHELIERILGGRRPYVISPEDPFVRHALGSLPALGEIFGPLGVRRKMAVPLFAGGKPVGVLSIGSATPGGWDEEDLRVAALIADRAGIAIQNVQLMESERQARQRAELEARRANAFNTILTIAASSFDLGSVFDEFGEALRSLIPFTRVTVSLYVPERDWLATPYFKGPELQVPASRLEGPKAGTVRGWVIDHGRPFIRNDTQEITQFEEDALLRSTGVRSYAVLPMTVGGRTIGTLNFGQTEAGAFTEEHVKLVQPIADQLALMVSRFQLFEQVQRRAGELSEALQQALLPADLPHPPFAALGVLYRAADPEAKIGGDWFDAVLLEDDPLLVSIGDVAGHGVPAAATMGQARHIVRAYALEGRSPAEILTAVNDYMAALPETLQLSMWIARVDPYTGEMTYAGGGHPPVLLAIADGDLSTLASGGPPLGIFGGMRYRQAHARMSPGSRLIAYTDGLIEATRNVLEGEERLHAAIRASRDLSPREAVEAILRRTLEDTQPMDDIALLILDLLPLDAPLSFSLPASPRSLRRVRHAVRAFTQRVGVPRERVDEIVVATGEAAANVVEHAYTGRSGTLTVRAERTDEAVAVVVSDFGLWRPPVDRGRGRGSRIMQNLSDSIVTHTGPAGTTVHLTFLINPAPARSS